MGQTPIVVAVYATLALTLGGQWIAAKLGVTAVPALELSTMRFAIAAAVLLAACAITRTPIPLRRWRPIAAAAACGVLGFNTLAFVGLSLTPASDSALIIPTTIPMATALFATLIHERSTSRKLFGFAVASVGAALVIVGGQEGASEPSSLRLRGDLLELGAATAWAASLTIGAVVLRKETVLGYVTLMVLIGTAMLVPLGLLAQAYRDVPSWAPETWLAAGFLGVFSTAVAYVLFFWAVHRFGASLAAMVSYLTPVATLVLAFLILAERPLPLQLAGAAVIVVGVRLAARRSAAALRPTTSAV
ncbi:MAG TPA: DMT family transporter [Candidatus Limnocylindria bacterium]|nr:DMT family transporter [Candidatus Limnocylindria bacterium]